MPLQLISQCAVHTAMRLPALDSMVSSAFFSSACTTFGAVGIISAHLNEWVEIALHPNHM